MKLKRIFSLILVCSLLFTITACSKDKKPSGNSSTENVNSSDNGILSQLPVGGDETSSEKFDNTIGTDISTPKPGYDYSDTITNKPATVPESTKEESSYKLSELLQPVENDSDKVEFKSDLQYLYEGVNYVYGITAEGREIIAYKDVKGNIIDNMEGAGNFNIKSNQGLEILTAGSIKSITPSMSGSNFILTVTYEPEGINAAESSIKIVYVFRDYSIGVTAQVITSGNYYISPKNSFFKRRFLNGVSDKSWRAVDKWTYPQNGDYPYQETDSACMITELDDTHQTYTFVRGENLPDLLFKESYETGDPVLTNIENNKKGLNYTFNCDIVLASKKDADEDTDYMALFAGRGGDFAVGISPLKPEKDNSTIFVGDEVSLNLNVMNLSTETVKFSLRYDIRDYYGNIVDAGLFINSSVFKNQEANRNITIKPEKKGIFYLNLYAVSKYYKYQECYPFALLPEHTYKYNATSPFGMSTNESNIEYAYLSAKIGIANQRVNTQHIQMAKNLYEQGITRINGQAHMKNWPIKGDEKVPTIEACKQNLEIFKMEFTNHLKNLPKYFDSVEIGNELNNWTMSSDTYTPEDSGGTQLTCC